MMRGIVIAGTHSGCGKTTVALGIMACLRKRGLNVQPFKTGPDFIDAGLHYLAAGRQSSNLDQWMCGDDGVVRSYLRAGHDADIAVVEGVMGMYDGRYNTSRLARLLDLPVILVIDASGMAESAAAVAKGFAEYEKEHNSGPNIKGVIFNRVASARHFERLKKDINNLLILGYLPREAAFGIPHRHLGLVTAEERPLSPENLSFLSEAAEKNIDLDAVIAISRAPAKSVGMPGHERRCNSKRFRLGIVYDEAFNFYYRENIELLQEAGAEIISFSLLKDSSLPKDIDSIYIGGGYPELHAEKLSGNRAMLSSIREWAEAGRPLYAECGGLMYLSRGIQDMRGRFFDMAGVFGFSTRMLKRPRLGYRNVRLGTGCILGMPGDLLKGHEFHYSEIVSGGYPEEAIYDVKTDSDEEAGPDGFVYKNTLAGYIHMHFGSNPSIAACFADFSKGVRTA